MGSQRVGHDWVTSLSLFSINPSSEYSGLISLRIDWFDLLAVQETLKGLLQHHSSKASILQCLAYFMVQLSHLYLTTGKTIALTRPGSSNIYSRCASCFNIQKTKIMASGPITSCQIDGETMETVIDFIFLDSKLTAATITMILEPKKIKSVTVSPFSPSICHAVMKLDAMTLVFECWVLSQLFYSHLSCSSRGSLVPLHFLPLEWYHLLIWGCWYLSWQS